MPQGDESLSSEIDDKANESGYRLKRLLEMARLEAETALRRLSRSAFDTSVGVLTDELTMEPMNIWEAQ